MKTNLFILLIFLTFSQSLQSQVSIQCPQDLTVHLFDLDSDYESYGDPIVLANANYDIVSNITVVDNACMNIETTINYLATDENGNTAKCKQIIDVTFPKLEDISWPEETVTIEIGSPENTKPESTGFPEPQEHINSGSSIYTTYYDQVISSIANGPYKVIRTWTALDWCTSDSEEFIQIIRINQLEAGALGAISVATCSGGIVNAQELNVTTDQANFTIDDSSCTLDNNDILTYMNCIADNNNINATNNFSLELTSMNDDYLNGVSTIDLVRSQRHILGIETFNEQCKILGGDVSNDGRVSALDLVETRKLILGIITNLSKSDSWRFYNAKAVTGNQPNADLKFNKSEFPLSELELIAVKIGDVNGSALSK